jgi:serine/threonine-protein kinase
MFLDEARLASMIQHPNVCTVHDLGVEQGTLFLVMEWVSGVSLNTLLRRLPERRLGPRLSARILADVCAGLHAAHELRDENGNPLLVVHRDVSPHNVLISADGNAKIADFGVAKARGQMHEATATGEIKGKVDYLAPEQVNRGELDRRVDVFALGSVLYQMTLGKKPFFNENPVIALYDIAEARFQHPRAVDENYPPELESIILKAMALKPEDRFPSADAMRMALEEFLASGTSPVTSTQVASVVKRFLGEAIDQQERRIRKASDHILDSGSDAIRHAAGIPANPTRSVTPPPQSVSKEETSTSLTVRLACEVSDGSDGESPTEADSVTQPKARPTGPSRSQHSRVPSVITAMTAALVIFIVALSATLSKRMATAPTGTARASASPDFDKRTEDPTRESLPVAGGEEALPSPPAALPHSRVATSVASPDESRAHAGAAPETNAAKGASNPVSRPNDRVRSGRSGPQTIPSSVPALTSASAPTPRPSVGDPRAQETVSTLPRPPSSTRRPIDTQDPALSVPE